MKAMLIEVVELQKKGLLHNHASKGKEIKMEPKTTAKRTRDDDSDSSDDYTAPRPKRFRKVVLDSNSEVESSDDDESYSISDFTETRAAVKAAIDE